MWPPEEITRAGTASIVPLPKMSLLTIRDAIQLQYVLLVAILVDDFCDDVKKTHDLFDVNILNFNYVLSCSVVISKSLLHKSSITHWD